LFFRKVGKPDWRFPCAARDQGFYRYGQEMTRKWRRKPLKSLKTDSEIAIHGIAIVKHKNRLGEFRMS
jgi:hypothetical protein